MAMGIPGLENINWSVHTANVMYWLGYGLLGIIVLVMIIVIWNYSAYQIKAIVYPLYGSGRDGIYSIGIPKKNSIRWVDKKTAWKSLKPYFNKDKRQPFDPEYIYPGKGPNKNVIIFELGGQWIPGRVNISRISEEEIRAAIDPIPSYLRNWEIITHKQIDQELQSENFMAKYGAQVMTAMTVLFCIACCLGAIWMSYKFAGAGREDVQIIKSAIDTLVSGRGIAPQ